MGCFREDNAKVVNENARVEFAGYYNHMDIPITASLLVVTVPPASIVLSIS